MPRTLARHDTMSLLATPGILEMIIEDAKEEAKNNPRPQPEPERPAPNASYTEDEYRVYSAARRIGEIVYEELEKHDGTSKAGGGKSLWLQDRRYESVNPYYSQTASGLRFEIYYGQPSTVHTPWGEWHVAGSGSSIGGAQKPFTDAILSRLSASTYIAEYYDHGPLGGVIGPVYNVGGVDGRPLPVATDHERGAKTRRSYEDAKAQWEAMTARYNAENPSKIPHDPYAERRAAEAALDAL